MALLLFLLVSRALAPAAAHFQRDLYFDYTTSDVAATASFLFTGAAASEPPFVKVQVVDSDQGRMARPRMLPPGQRMDVWLELDMPESNGASSGDMFQVRGKLLTSDGRMLAAVSRPCLVPHRSPLVRMFRMAWRAPLELLGLGSERQVLRLPLFLGYRELRDAPFATFHATLQARARGGEVPRLYSAKAHVYLRLGPLRRIFYWARPGYLATLLLAAAALAALGGGGLTCVALLLLLWLLLRHADAASGAGAARRGSGAASVPDDVSSEAGCSDASSGLLDSDSGSERAAGDGLDARAANPNPSPAPRAPWATGGLGGGAMRRSGRSAPDSLAKRTLSGGFG
ncbi:hypothetical protein WJX81_007180 [Elliptochloris bilobata]|uniref:Seipin n=1 Tax=Elliptochloris bilobata TaxID=381761 RepID=A0AAW1SAP3_9CHLO